MTFTLLWANTRSTSQRCHTDGPNCCLQLHTRSAPPPHHSCSCNKAMETCHPHLNPQVTQLACGRWLWLQEHAATPQLTLHQEQQDTLGLYLSSCCAAHFSLHSIPTASCKLLGRRKSKVERVTTLILFPDIGRIHHYWELDWWQLKPFNF